MRSVSEFSAEIAALYDRVQAGPLNPVWISLVPKDVALERAREVENHPEWPLAGKTFGKSCRGSWKIRARQCGTNSPFPATRPSPFMQAMI